MPLSPSALATLRKLRGDFAFYAPRVLKIRTKTGAITPFALNRAQVYLNREIERMREETG